MLKKEYHIVAPIPKELVDEARRVTTEIRSTGATKENKEALFQLIMKMTEEGVDFFFMEPLRRMGAGSMIKKMASMGLSSMIKATRMVIHKVLKNITDDNMEHILDFIDDILYEPETDQ